MVFIFVSCTKEGITDEADEFFEKLRVAKQEVLTQLLKLPILVQCMSLEIWLKPLYIPYYTELYYSLLYSLASLHYNMLHCSLTLSDALLSPRPCSGELYCALSMLSIHWCLTNTSKNDGMASLIHTGTWFSWRMNLALFYIQKKYNFTGQ